MTAHGGIDTEKSSTTENTDQKEYNYVKHNLKWKVFTPLNCGKRKKKKCMKNC